VRNTKKVISFEPILSSNVQLGNFLVMKKYFVIPALLLSLFSLAQPNSQRKIQVAILFDTSNSMDGLIDQAKSRIWTIINDLSGLRHQGQVPTIEIALYDYGNSSLIEL